jgi:hypothetical protein
LDFWFENIQSGNPDPDQKKFVPKKISAEILGFPNKDCSSKELQRQTFLC